MKMARTHLWKTKTQGIKRKIKTMTSQELLKSDVLDILFENRNKNYGAYVLRKFYHVRLSEALFSATAGILLITYLCKPQYEKSYSPVGRTYPDSVVVHTVHVPDTKLPKNPSSSKPSATLAQISYTNVRISDHAKTTDVPDMGNLGNAIISNITRDGIPSDHLLLPPLPVESPLEKPAPAQPFVPAYAAPEFPGG